MDIKFKGLQFLNASKDYFLLCNSRLLNVYHLNGELINEFKINLLSDAILVDDKIYVSQTNRKSISCIDIFTGVKKKISFKNDVKKVNEIYNMGNKKLIILAFQYVYNENNECEYQSRVILYDIESDTYKLMIMDKDESIDKVLFYKGKPYFMVRLIINEVNKYNKIYMLNDSDCLEEYMKQGIPLKITNYAMCRDNRFFMMLDTTLKTHNTLKIYDPIDSKLVFSYIYDKSAYGYLANIFKINNIPYVCIYDNIGDRNKMNELISSKMITKIYNLETGTLVKELTDFYIIVSLSNRVILYEFFKFGSGRSNTFHHIQ